MISTMTEIVNKVIFKRAINFFIFSATIVIIVTIITYMINPDFKEVMKENDSNSLTQVRESTGMDQVGLFIVNNGFLVPLQMFFFALIPIQFLYFVNIISTISSLGVFFGIALQIDFEKGFELIISSLPHFIFEIFGFCLLAAVLFELNQVVRGKIRNLFKKNKEGHSLIKKFIKTIIAYAVFVLPIIIVAAFLETYIADIILSLFQ